MEIDAAQAEVDAAWVQRLERTELLGDHQRRVVRQHDPRSPDPDPLGMCCNVRREDLGGAARKAGHVVVLGDPVAPISSRLYGLGDADSAGDRRVGNLAVLYADEVED